ncbi:MAG: MBL fold metallo-hydrolase [Patescibacteria group bacterium]
MYNVRQLVLGDFLSNCYIVSDSQRKTALIIDPADTPEYIGEKLIEMRLTPIAMIATHGHFDHVLAAFGLQVFFSNLPFFVHPNDMFLIKRMQKTVLHFTKNRTASPAPEDCIDIEKFESSLLGEERIEILDLAGHTPGSIGLYCNESHAVFVGDTMFSDGSVGDTHHVYSDKIALKKSIEKITALPSNTMMYAGHGERILIGDLGLQGVYS